MAVVELTPSDDGRTVRVDHGDEIILRLAESPTTGYRWEIVRIDAPLTVLDDSFELGSGPQFGSGGVRLIRLQAVASGEGRLELKHWQPWEGEASVSDLFSFTVSVAGA